MGDTREFGWALLEILRADGWQVSEIKRGSLCKVRAEWPSGEEFFCVAPSFAEAALDVFEACVAYRRTARLMVAEQISLFSDSGAVEH